MGKPINKRDKGRPRTVDDLEREYNFEGMVKTIKDQGKKIDELTKLVNSLVNK